MVNYQQGKIYRIVSNITGKQYIGSTAEPRLSRRLVFHRSAYKQYIQGKITHTTSFEIIEQGNYEILLVENFPCENKDRLHARERHFIETMECVNKVIPTRTRQERDEANKDILSAKSKQYSIDNKDLLSQKNKLYRQQNRDDLLEKKRLWDNANKDRAKQYREVNKDKMNEYKRLWRLKKRQEQEQAKHNV